VKAHVHKISIQIPKLVVLFRVICQYH